MRIHLAQETRYLPDPQIRKLALQHARGVLGSRELRIEAVQIQYKLFFFLKILALASRFPFKPKRRGYVLFFDSVSGVGGLTNGVPVWEERDVAEDTLWESAYPPAYFTDQQPALIEKHVLRRYLLKRPELEVQGLEQIWLPYQICTCSAGDKRYRVVLNAETGHPNI